MKAKDLTHEIEEFQSALVAHRDLYARSLDSVLPEYPVENENELCEQSRRLARVLGRLRPFLQRFRQSWLMHNTMSGISLDFLDAAVGMANPAQIKGNALDHAIDAVEQTIGRLHGLDPNDEIPDDSKSPIKSGGPVDRVILGYLDHLHPFIREGCAQLFLDVKLRETEKGEPPG